MPARCALLAARCRVPTVRSSVGSGFYNGHSGQSECTPCVMGRFAENVSQTECVDCPEGRFLRTEGQRECTLCDEGRYGPTRGLTICVACEAGRVQGSVGEAQSWGEST